VQDVRLRDPIMEWDVVEYAAYGEERVGLVLQLAAPASCVVQPLVREQGGAVGAKSLWLEHPDVAFVEVELTNVRACAEGPACSGRVNWDHPHRTSSNGSSTRRTTCETGAGSFEGIKLLVHWVCTSPVRYLIAQSPSRGCGVWLRGWGVLWTQVRALEHSFAQRMDPDRVSNPHGEHAQNVWEIFDSIWDDPREE
jgi:hypothetical protein